MAAEEAPLWLALLLVSRPARWTMRTPALYCSSGLTSPLQVTAQLFVATSSRPCRLSSGVEIVTVFCLSRAVGVCCSIVASRKREDEALHEGELPPKDLERAEAAMRALIRIFLLLDFALVWLFLAS
jgi:hypothetical protein